MPASAEKRSAGNELYKARRFADALELYTQAAADGDELAEGNRAAALFELGRFSESFQSATAAARYAAKGGDAARVARLYQRAARAALCGGSFAQAAEAAELGGESCEGILRAAESAKASKEPSAREARALLRPSPISTCTEYYAFGHGRPMSMLMGPLRVPGGETLGLQDKGKVEPEVFDAAEKRQKSLGPDVEAVLEEGEAVAFFLGGAGDARHAMATIRDFANLPMVKSFGGAWTSDGKAGLQIVLNDIKIESLARNVIVFVLLLKLADHGEEPFKHATCATCDNAADLAEVWQSIEAAHRRVETDSDYCEALEDLALLTHVLASPFLLPVHYARLKDLVEMLAESPAPPSAWLTATAEDWAALREVFSFWATNHFDGRLLDGLVNDYSFGGVDANQDGMLNNMESAMQEKMLESMQQLPDDKIQFYFDSMKGLKEKAAEEGITSAEGRRAMVISAIRSVMKEHGRSNNLSLRHVRLSGMYCDPELELAAEHKLMLPPIELWKEYGEFLGVQPRGAVDGQHHSAPPHQEVLHSVRNRACWNIHAAAADMMAWSRDGSAAEDGEEPLCWSWMGNLTIVARDHVEEASDIESEEDEDELAEGEVKWRCKLVPREDGMRLDNHILFMMDDFVDSELTEEEEATRESVCRARGAFFRARCLCDHFSPFLVAVASALRSLVSSRSIQLHIAPGDMHAAGLACKERGDRFIGIHLSNVPDYTGLCNMMTAFRPLLRDPPAGGMSPWSHELGPSDRISSYIRHEILLNCGLMGNVETMVLSATHLPSMSAVGAVFGLQYAGGDMASQIFWQPCTPFQPLPDTDASGQNNAPQTMPPRGAPCDEASLRAWLIRLLLAIGLPAKRDAFAIQVENSSETMAAWARIVALLSDAGWPRHWLARLLEDISSGSVLTLEAAPKRSPCPWTPLKTEVHDKAARMDLSPILPDLRAACWIFPQLRFCASPGLLEEQPHWFEWAVSTPAEGFGDDKLGSMMWMMPEMLAQGRGSPGVLGLLTLPGGVAAALQAIKRLRTRNGSIPRNLAALAGAKACLFSMLQFDSQRKQLRILLTGLEHDCLRRGGHVGFLVRTDSWEPLRAMGCFPISESRRLE